MRAARVDEMEDGEEVRRGGAGPEIEFRSRRARRQWHKQRRNMYNVCCKNQKA